MIGKEPRLRTIVAINLQLVFALMLIAYGWVCWSWTSAEWWGLAVPAFLCMAGGTIAIIAAINRIVALIGRERSIDGFKRQGSA
ncbi:MAG: hypothetical protein KDK08_26940, partial [Rhizobiaceae bacterium]|nr:hypothetical protein [Rhizobiaceae bacterium]